MVSADGRRLAREAQPRSAQPMVVRAYTMEEVAQRTFPKGVSDVGRLQPDGSVISVAAAAKAATSLCEAVFEELSASILHARFSETAGSVERHTTGRALFWVYLPVSWCGSHVATVKTF